MAISLFTSHVPQPERASGPLHVADLARRAAVTPATVRYYARIGLLNPGRDVHNGYRRFSSDDLHRLTFVRKAQLLGLTIGDIRSILEQIEDGQPVRGLVADLVRNRLREVRRQRAELEAVEIRMEDALSECSAASASQRESGKLCPLIEEIELREGATGRPSGHGEEGMQPASSPA